MYLTGRKKISKQKENSIPLMPRKF